MKKYFIIIPFVVIALCSFKFAYDVRKNTAEVAKEEGLFVFVDSEPVTPYEKLGTVGGGTFAVVMNPQYSVVKKALVRKAKEKFENADGVILYLNSNGKDRADVIKFK